MSSSSDPPSSTPPTGAEQPPSFLDRERWGLKHWLLIAMAAIFVLAFVPRGVRKAIESNVNNAEDWLPADYPESTALRWFARHYVGAKFVLVSWDGCTLADEATIGRVVADLRSEKDDRGQPAFRTILTGPAQVASLTQAPSNLSRQQAIRRLEGALVGPRPELTTVTGNPDQDRRLADQQRTTCIVAYLSPYMTESNQRMRGAVERVEEIAAARAGVGLDQVHMGGPPVDNITIDIEGEKTLLRLAGFSGVVGLALSFWCFRSLRLTWFVFSVAGISAGVSLAIVYWYGVFEINTWIGLGYAKKHLGTVDAILMSMPAVVYVLGLSGAIHIVNYYRDERDERGQHGAAERGVRIGWGPCALAALTTAVGLGSLGASQIVPIQKFGVFCAAGVLATVLVLLTILPISLHLFPPKLPGDGRRDANRRRKTKAPALPAWAAAWAKFVTHRHGLVTAGCLTAMAFFAYGLTKTDTEVRLLKLLDPGTSLIQDYAWFEEHLGNLVPMEVIVTLDDDQLRGPKGIADDGKRYRMTMLERLTLVRRLQERIESLEPVSRAMSAATFGPTQRPVRSALERRAVNRATSQALEESREALGEYLAVEKQKTDGEAGKDDGAVPTGRELWRISARVAALSDVDYGDFVGNLQQQVEPVLDVYRLRDELLAKLRDAGKPLVGSRVLVLFDGEPGQAAPAEGTDDRLLAKLLTESGVAWTTNRGRGRVGLMNTTDLAGASGEELAKRQKQIGSYDAMVTVSPTAAALREQLAGVVEQTPLVSLAESGVATAPTRSDANLALEPDTSLAAVYTGIVPLVYKTQRELLASLQTSMGWATVLIGCVMIAVLRSPAGGAVSMIPNIFPVVSVFGSLGWLGVKIDIGIMMTASVALGVAVDDTIHFLTWFRRGIVQGLDRRSATLLAFDRCAVAMTQTTLIAGLGLAVFATSTFTPTQQFGYLMITMLGAALVGDLVMLPAILCGPLGRFFAPGAPPTPDHQAPAERIEASEQPPQQPAEEIDSEEVESVSEAFEEEPTILSITDAPGREGEPA
ncbi:MAG: MMPL family transporter, partial [Planctomycetota bacterium]